MPNFSVTGVVVRLPSLNFQSGWFHLMLFIATALSTFATFLFSWGGGVDGTLRDRMWGSAMFAGSVILILGAHEMGHYVAARVHGVDSTLPYFIPVPFGFGTMGAVIRLKSRIPTRNALVDIGAAGPLAGLCVALPLLVAGIAWSTPVPVPVTETTSFPSPMSLWSIVSDVVHAFRDDTPALGMARAQVEVFGDNLVSLALVWLIKGPLPKGVDLAAHPVLIAAWFGMLVTMLNLIPVGQLDGGHLTHAWFQHRAETAGRWIARALLIPAVFFSVSWLVWFFLVTKIVKIHHPPVLEATEGLSIGRKRVCLVCFAAAVLTFMPIPLGVI
jgi:membrane-associated protease RseP (regulator of RpoE activity)